MPVATTRDIIGAGTLELPDVLHAARKQVECTHYFRVRKGSQLNQLYEQMAQAADLKGVHPERMLLYPFEQRQNVRNNRQCGVTDH